MEEQRVQRKLAAILAADVVGYSRLTGADEEGTIARLRALRRELIDPAIAAHRGRIFKTTGDGMLVEFASAVDAARCAIAVQREMPSRNADVPPDHHILFRIGVNVGDVIVEVDGDLLGDAVNIAARLEAVADASGICLSYDALRQIEGKIAIAAHDLGDQEFKNIARPVRVFRLEVAPTGTLPVGRAAARAASPRLTIVVLPFTNLTGDRDQDYFVDGITDSLTTDLSRIPNSLVIARNTAFSFKGKPIEAGRIGRELGVRYLLEGSIQRGGDHLRVNAKLIDTETGAHVWAERFDRKITEIFDMQDEIVAHVARSVRVEAIVAEAERSKRRGSTNLDALDLAYRGFAAFNRPPDGKNIVDALKYFEQALELDPECISALTGLAQMQIAWGMIVELEEVATCLRTTEAAAMRAIALAPNDASAHNMLGQVFTFTKRVALGVAEFQLALSLDSNYSPAHANLGLAQTYAGRPEQAAAHCSDFFRLSPRDRLAAYVHWYDGDASLHCEKYSAAEEKLRRAVEAGRYFGYAHLWLASALAHQGKVLEAAAAAEAGLRLAPAMTIARLRAHGAVTSDNPTWLARRERIYEGLRKAEVPEG